MSALNPAHSGPVPAVWEYIRRQDKRPLLRVVRVPSLNIHLNLVNDGCVKLQYSPFIKACQVHDILQQIQSAMHFNRGYVSPIKDIQFPSSKQSQVEVFEFYGVSNMLKPAGTVAGKMSYYHSTPGATPASHQRLFCPWACRKLVSKPDPLATWQQSLLLVAAACMRCGRPPGKELQYWQKWRTLFHHSNQSFFL